MPEKSTVVSMPTQQLATELSWESVNEPGTYVDVSTGELYRFPPEALIQGSSPVIRKESLRAARLVQISRHPDITTFQARLLACEHNVQPNF
jgi:hypothetical protein